MARLSARLGALGEHTRTLGTFAVDAARLVPAEHGATVDQNGWLVELDADGTARLYGYPNATDVQKEIAAWLHLSWGPPASAPVYLAADAGASVAAVARTIAQVRAAGVLGEVRLLVSVPGPPIEPTDTFLLDDPSVAALRKAIDSQSRTSEKVSLLSRALKPAVRPCAPVIRVLGWATGGGKWDALRTAPDAARECRCVMADLDVFEFVMLTLVRAFEPGVRWLPVPALRGGDWKTLPELVRATK